MSHEPDHLHQAGAGNAASQAAAQTNNRAEDAAQTQQTAAAGSQTDQTSETDETDDDSDTTNLAIYTDEQLAQMLADGEINQSQYALEMASRDAQKQAEAQAAEQQPVNKLAE